jgi:hypothetical protein
MRLAVEDVQDSGVEVEPRPVVEGGRACAMMQRRTVSGIALLRPQGR